MVRFYFTLYNNANVHLIASKPTVATFVSQLLLKFCTAAKKKT